jgi:aminopeptidase YwaD
MVDMNASHMYTYIEEMCTYGPRNINSSGDIKSMKYISGILKKTGFDVIKRSFRVGVYSEKRSEIKVKTGSTDIQLDSVSHYRSGDTPSSGIKGEIVYVGFGSEEEVSKNDVHGKICLADTGAIHPVSKADVAKKHGAVGCIWIHGHAGRIIAAWGLHRFGAPIPVMGVSYEDGVLLKEMLEKNRALTAEILVEAETSEGEGINLIGYKKGEGDEIVALCAHRETTHTTPGANDNGSGVAVMLGIANALQKNPLKRSIALIFSSGEEGGGFGMQDYLENHPDEAARYIACINLDMVGEGSKLRLVEKGRKSKEEEYTYTSRWLNTLLKKSAADLGYHIGEDIVCEYGMADAGHFINKNVHTAWFYKPDDPYFHTKEDTPDKINPNDLKATGDIVLRVVEQLQNMERIPEGGGS